MKVPNIDVKNPIPAITGEDVPYRLMMAIEIAHVTRTSQLALGVATSKSGVIRILAGIGEEVFALEIEQAEVLRQAALDWNAFEEEGAPPHVMKVAAALEIVIGQAKAKIADGGVSPSELAELEAAPDETPSGTADFDGLEEVKSDNMKQAFYNAYAALPEGGDFLFAVPKDIMQGCVVAVVGKQYFTLSYLDLAQLTGACMSAIGEFPGDQETLTLFGALTKVANTLMLLKQPEGAYVH